MNVFIVTALNDDQEKKWVQIRAKIRVMTLQTFS